MRYCTPHSTPSSTMAVHQRSGSPFWYIQFQYRGKTYIKSSKTTDKKLALKLETVWRSQLIEQQQLGQRQQIELRLAFQQYSLSKQKLTSYRNIKLWCDRAAEHWSNIRYLHELRSTDIERYHATLQNAGYANQTIKHAINQVSGTLRYAKNLEYETANVVFPKLKIPRGRLRYLSVEEEKRLLQAVDPQREVKGLAPYCERTEELRREMQDVHDLVIMLIDTGARHSEITTMKWSAINLTDRTIKLWRSKVQNQSLIYMTTRVYEILTRRNRESTTEWIFNDSGSGHRQYRAGTFRRIFDRAGLPDCSIHTLRHTHASRLIQNGLNLYEVKEILGHSDIKTTMRYSHLEQTGITRRAAEVMERFSQ